MGLPAIIASDLAKLIHKKRADESRSLSHRYPANLVKSDARFDECARDDGSNAFQMLARCKLRHHSAKRSVSLNLRSNDVRLDDPALFDDGGRRFVTRTLYSKNQHAKSFYTTTHAHRSVWSAQPCS